MTRGLQIKILLADGSVTGIRHAEIDRLQDHLANKEFWNEVILFTNKDDHLTKAHVRYLEPKLVETAKASKRYVVLNATTPQSAQLPRGDRAAMESFLEQVRLLLGVLGHRVLEPFTGSATSPVVSTTPPAHDVAPKSESAVGAKVEISTKAVHANAVLTDEGVVVLAGSQAASKASAKMPESYKRLRDQLIQQGILTDSGSGLRFAEDHLFSSASAAASVVTGYAINGRDAWKTSDGISVGEIEQRLASAT